MYCTNTMKIEMNNNIKAIKAMDIIESVVPFIRKSISIYSYVQKQVMILKHL